MQYAVSIVLITRSYVLISQNLNHSFPRYTMERNIYFAAALVAQCVATGVWTYFVVSQQFSLIIVEFINFSFVWVITLLVLPFTVLALVKIKQPLEDRFSRINSLIHQRVRIAILFLAIVSTLMGFCNIFYEYFAKRRSDVGLWSIQINIYTSLVAFVLYSRSLMPELSKKLLYSTYILMVIFGILFLSQLTIITSNEIYAPEVCIQIVSFLVTLDCWWDKTPIIFNVLMLAADVVSIEEIIRYCVLNPDRRWIVGYEGTVAFIILTHAVIKLAHIVWEVYKCIRQFNDEEDKADMPLPLMAISQIPLSQFKKEQLQQSSNNIGEGEGSCAICTMKIEEGVLVYDIPCGHYFHSECLGKWLGVRNSCPSCRKPAI